MKIKKIGGSFFGRIPSSEAKALNLRENQELRAEIVKKKDYMSIFGMGKHLGLNAQQMKDELREEDDF
ncbi:hypothetical protein HY989_04535 [Candidatus Micrarchaeota archaeon]|nr:hypothetical protein [Candidatus Micrarchaeota archaeon]